MACFEKPVAWDLLGENGEKIAGAGQRRSRYGVLHQGSVQAPAGALDELSDFLSRKSARFQNVSVDGWKDRETKYASTSWLELRV